MVLQISSLVNLKEERLANVYKSIVFGRKLLLFKVVHLEAKYLLKRSAFSLSSLLSFFPTIIGEIKGIL